MRSRWLIIGIVLLAACTTQQEQAAHEELTYAAKLTGTTGEGDVAIELRPHDFSEGMLSVEVSVNTHSVDLTQYDLVGLTTLSYGEKRIAAAGAPAMRGHHVFGSLLFPVEQIPEDFTISITGIPQMEERIYRWGG